MNAKSIPLPKIDFQSIADDFRFMNPNDPGAWPIIPKITVLVGLFVAIIVAGWWFIWNDQLTELETKQHEEETLKQQYLDKKRQAVNLDLYVQQLAEIDRSFGALLKQLPDKSEIEALLIEINQAGLGRGLQFELFKTGAGADQGLLRRIADYREDQRWLSRFWRLRSRYCQAAAHRDPQ